jgi:hypothetical protein
MPRTSHDNRVDIAGRLSPAPGMLEDMSFKDLPADWAQRPITDPDVFEGVVDLIVADQARREGSTYVLLCHEGGPVDAAALPPR